MVEKLLEKIPMKELYKDVFQPGLRKAGEALETIIDTGNLILLPIKLVQRKSRVYLKDNLKRYEEKLNRQAQKEIIQIPQHVYLPIIDKLTYLDQKDLSEAFINLLTKASFNETISMVHPSFFNILENLSSDEAKILFHLKDKERCPLIDIHGNRSIEKIKKPAEYNAEGNKTRNQLKQLIEYEMQERDEVDIKAAMNLTGLENLKGIDFPNNIDVYIENLEINGLIRFVRGRYNKEDELIYTNLKDNVYKEKISEYTSYLGDARNNLTEDHTLSIRAINGFIEFTELGKLFIKTCIKDIE